MNAWYLSYNRFEKRILKRWHKTHVKYNAGNVNILKYSFRTVLYYANLKNQKVSKANKINIEPKLF